MIQLCYNMSEMNDQEGSPPVVGGGDGVDPEASKIAEVLRLVASDIGDKQSETLFQEIITSLARESVSERKYNILTNNIRRFVIHLGFSVKFSVSKTKEILHILMVMWNQPDIARYVIKEVYKEDINADGTPIDHETLQQIPSDVRQLQGTAADIYAKALKDGKEDFKNIRLMVVGMFGVGKTSLVNNMIIDFRKKQIVPPSTEGIDLHRCQLMQNGDWCLDNEHKTEKYRKRLENAFKDVNKIPTIINVPPGTTDGLDNTDGVPVEIKPASVEQYNRKDTETLQTYREKVEEHQQDENVIECLKLAQKIIEPSENIRASLDKPMKHTTVSVWDFAGQALYYSTHQFFLNRRSIYLVLMDVTKGLNEVVKESERSETWCGLVQHCTYLDVFKFWLNAIHMYSGYKSISGEIHPTVILVGTRKDEMMGSDEEKIKKNDEYFDHALRSFKGSPVLKHIHKRKFLVNNLSPDDSVFSEIQEDVKCLAEMQDYWGEKYPLRWIHMEQSLDKLRDKGARLLNMEEIEKENRSTVQTLNEDELALFLDIQHMHGNILYFNTDELKQLVVLAPQWIIEVFKRFIKHVPNKDPNLSEHWEIYEELAILKPEVFHEIMDNSPPDIKENRNDVIKYMEYLDVMAKPIEETTEENDNTNAAEHLNAKFLDFHIVPCRLKNPPPPISKFTAPTNIRKTPVLCFVFCEKFMPPSFFHRLVAVCIRSWRISKVDCKNQLYNELVVFDLRKTYTLTIWYKDHIIYARIAFYSTECTTDIDFNLCQEVRITLRRSLLKCVGQSLENPMTPTAFDEYIQCPDMKMSLYNEGMFRVNAFMYDREINCEACPVRHAIGRDKAMTCWFNEALNRFDEASDSPAEETHLKKAASVVGEEYWMLGIELGLTDKQMNHLYAPYAGPAYKNKKCEFVFKYMVEWRNRDPKEATLQRLNRAIHAARLNFSNDEIISLIF